MNRAEPRSVEKAAKCPIRRRLLRCRGPCVGSMGRFAGRRAVPRNGKKKGPDLSGSGNREPQVSMEPETSRRNVSCMRERRASFEQSGSSGSRGFQGLSGDRVAEAEVEGE